MPQHIFSTSHDYIDIKLFVLSMVVSKSHTQAYSIEFPGYLPPYHLLASSWWVRQ